MPIVLLGTWRRFVNKFDPYVMNRSVNFFIFAFSGQKKTFWHVHLSIVINSPPCVAQPTPCSGLVEPLSPLSVVYP